MALRAGSVRVSALEPWPLLKTWRLFQSNGALGKYAEWVVRRIWNDKRLSMPVGETRSPHSLDGSSRLLAHVMWAPVLENVGLITLNLLGQSEVIPGSEFISL
jgi:hypothetical protein